jgi:hypothetical protein
MSGHTPGPWSAEGYFHSNAGDTFEPKVWIAATYEGRSIRVADIPDVLSEDTEEMANAHLMAAAPELLASIVELLELCDDMDIGTELTIARARAAIAKAVQS